MGFSEKLVFCDDTAFVAENPSMMDVLLNCYKTFIVRWTIRVNPRKCKVMYSESAAAPKAHYFGHSLIAEVTTLKYLGYSLHARSWFMFDSYIAG